MDAIRICASNQLPKGRRSAWRARHLLDVRLTPWTRKSGRSYCERAIQNLPGANGPVYGPLPRFPQLEANKSNLNFYALESANTPRSAELRMCLYTGSGRNHHTVHGERRHLHLSEGITELDAGLDGAGGRITEQQNQFARGILEGNCRGK